MIYDFDLIKSFLSDYGLEIEEEDGMLSVRLFDDVRMYVFNCPSENDNRITFSGDWHCHDGFYFDNKDGFCIELSYLDFLEELVSGNIIFCLQYINGELQDIYPYHIKYFDEEVLKYMHENEELRLRRFFAKKVGNK